jgi:hypothetical protein
MVNYTCADRGQFSLNPNCNTLAPARPQRDRPAACVTVQQEKKFEPHFILYLCILYLFLNRVSLNLRNFKLH